MGVKPQEFWNNSIAENIAIIGACNKKNSEDIYNLSALIRIAIVSSFNKDVKFPDLTPEQEERSNVTDWEASKAYMMILKERRNKS